MNRFLVPALVVLVSACGSASDPDRAASQDRSVSAASDASPRASRELRVPPDLQRKWGVVTGPVERLAVSGALRLPGVLALNQQRTAQVSALLEGKVLSISADLGDTVARDEVLLVLHSPAFAQAQTAFLQSYARRNLARREFERARDLLKDEAIQQKEYLRREAELEAATTDHSLAESNLHSLGWDHPQIQRLLDRVSRVGGDPSDLVEPTLRVRSPVGGRVIVRDVVVGEHVLPEKLLFVVSDLTTLWGILDAREQDLPALASARRASVESTVYAGRSFDARLTRTGDVVDEKLRTIKLRLEVPNPGLLLKPNMYVQGVIETGSQSRLVLAVPDEAVQTIDGEPAVFVPTPGSGFGVRPVRIGDRIGKMRTIAGGLDGHETVVVAGAFNLKAELLKSSFAGE